MSDSDSISDSTPNKRRKLERGSGKAWDSQDDSGEEFTVDDFNTVATLPLEATQQQQLRYTKDQFHADLRTGETQSIRRSSPPRTYITQPTQALTLGSQPTQPIQPGSSSPPLRTSDVLVNRSSPTPLASPPPKPPPQPIRKVFQNFTNRGLLASAIAPPGTAFRAPLGVQPKPTPTTIELDDSDDDDPPIYHSSDDEQTQGLRSNLKPTNFKKGGRGLDSTPNRIDQVVKESPRPPPPIDTFKNLLSEYSYNAKPANDSISAYANSSRQKSQQTSRQLGVKGTPKHNAVVYNTIEDVEDYVLRRKVLEIQSVLPHESVQRCMDALVRRRGNVGDAQEWLTADEEQDAPGEVESPIMQRGVATSSQPPRPAAKQQVKAPTLTIAEKYRRPSQPTSKIDESPLSPEDEAIRPRRRLMQGRKSARASPDPPSSPPSLPAPPARHRLKKRPATVEDDSDLEDALDHEQEPSEPEPIRVSTESLQDIRLLKFFNECSVEELADLSSQPEDVAQLVLDQRPFASLDAIRTVSNAGKNSRARPVGDKIVDTCSEVWTGYDAVDELVDACKRIAEPIQNALKGWGAVPSDDGELQLTNLDHDSGIGTPASSTPSDDAVPPSGVKLNKSKGFLSQPASMNPEFTLKDYQLVGLNWLDLLWSKKLSCILADEMGLGKTCQVISFLAHLQELEVNGVHLVIVPGSTLENWLREFRRFAPNLKVVPYYGAQSERAELQYQIEDDFETIDVIVTTIDMAVKKEDNLFLRKHVDPMVCVFDEAHALRNPQANRYKMLSKIPATFRILLTGTPLQNNLQELMAILAFIMPDLFREKKEELQYIFKHKASTKDVNNAALLSGQRIARARSMMTPFVLRRKKDKVLELPAKVNHVEYCEMANSQAAYYHSLIQQFLAESTGETTKSGMSNALMALRKAANHPLLALRLYDDTKIDKIVTELLRHPEYAENGRERTKDYLTGNHYQSFRGGDFGLHRFCRERPYLRKFELKKRQWMDAGKIGKFQELVKGFAANQDRVLVFSQFTTMMDILEAVLETLDIKFMRLDGSTSMQIRQDMIDQFTNDESITVFMLSTRAGGAGINLASANKVIIFDSGFNPQDDIQAENRAHRVGQTRPVDVYRLVTRGTIEEQIQAMGESKVELGERVAEGSNEEKQAEKDGEQIVAKMLLESLKKEADGKEEIDEEMKATPGLDLKDAFKSGLESRGVKVSSKQAQF